MNDAYKEKADMLNLWNERYWHLLLHMPSNESEIDDARFFLAPNGKTDAKQELEATIDAFYNEKFFDDNATACRFPARYAWLKERLELTDLPQVTCHEYDTILKRLSPTSATLVFPAAHVNSPASMFGHTFLRINSSYNSKLLSYAINYAADANPDETNAISFAINGLFGGYFGKYSLLPYYDKLKEYRDTESRDIWEYDLTLTKEETLQMVRHIWELNGTHSYYYFFTENCSYNMLWLIEIARPDIHLREHFSLQVIPLESVHATKAENLIESSTYRASKRSLLLEYEKQIEPQYLDIPKSFLNKSLELTTFMSDGTISQEQKILILEASIEFLEYSYSKSDMQKEEYISLFHELSKQRASLGLTQALEVTTPPNPVDSHRAIRAVVSSGVKEKHGISSLGIRPAYHDLLDSNYGFLRGTQIEFLDILLSHTQKKTQVEKATILSITSLTQKSTFINNFSWRTKIGWDNRYINDKPYFSTSVGIGLSYGNDYGYTYGFIDPLFYMRGDFISGIGASVGFVFDGLDFANTNLEITHRIYDDAKESTLVDLTQSFRTSQNTQLQLSARFDAKYEESNEEKYNEQTYRVAFNYYF
jgi:hypothetical protein